MPAAHAARAKMDITVPAIIRVRRAQTWGQGIHHLTARAAGRAIVISLVHAHAPSSLHQRVHTAYPMVHLQHLVHNITAHRARPRRPHAV